MDKDTAIGKTPSLVGQSVAAESAVGVNDLDNSTADNNQDDAVASPLSPLPNERLFQTTNRSKRQPTKSPPVHSPLSKETAKKTTKKTKHRSGSPSSPSDNSPIRRNNLNQRFQHSPRRARSSKPKKGVNISNKVILQQLRQGTFGKEIASENAYDADDYAKHDAPFATAAFNKFGHHKVALFKVKEGYLTNDFSRLSRFLIEDMLVQHNDDNEAALSFRLLISKRDMPSSEQMSSDDASFFERQKLAGKIFHRQQRGGVELGVHTREIMGTKYYELYATLVPNKTHKSIKAGLMTMEEIVEKMTVTPPIITPNVLVTWLFPLPVLVTRSNFESLNDGSTHFKSANICSCLNCSTPNTM